MPNGTVKFFNPSKGFGFITPDGGGADIFVHISAVERAGIQELNEGDQVSFQIEADRRSGKSSATDLVLTGSAPAPARRPARDGWAGDPRDSHRTREPFAPRNGSTRGAPESREVTGRGRGAVKWFNADKGFGFIQPEAGGEDVFVHISAVERAGIQGLREGEVLVYELETGRNGKTSAVNLRFADADR